MAMANTLAYYDMATFTAVKSFIVQSSRRGNNILHNSTHQKKVSCFIYSSSVTVHILFC
jgi:hypothetical protein